MCAQCDLSLLVPTDLIVLGTGSRVRRIDQAVIDYLLRKGINVEIQDTVSGCLPPSPLGYCAALLSPPQPHACATFNYLLDEARPAGAALIPPEYIPP